MASTNRSLSISKPAIMDLENVFEFGFYKFGESQALAYLDSFDEVFLDLLHNPLLGRTRKEILPDLRSLVHQSHIIFYKLSKTELLIIRILHSSRDVPKAF